MTSTSASNVTRIRIFQEARLDRSIGKIIDELKEQHDKIDDMIFRLLQFLATVWVVETSLESISSRGSIGEMRKALTEAQVVLRDISVKLESMNSGQSDGPLEKPPISVSVGSTLNHDDQSR